MPTKLPQITICVCTYKRPRYLSHLLRSLAALETDGLFTFSVVIVDNDRERAAEQVVAAFAKGAMVEVSYFIEPRQNIALARNAALSHVRGEFVAFIDDDEFPTKGWLKILFTECERQHVAGVLGPVMPWYEVEPPKWVLDGGFYERPSHPTGLIIDGSKGRTGNVLFRTAIIVGESIPFRPEFRTGEDQDFFHRMIAKGHVFIWCHEATAYEWVPPIRWKRSFLLRRALLRGTIAALRSNVGVRDVMKSVLAVIAYSVLLPLALLRNHGQFMRYLVSLVDHLGKLLALVGITPITEQYVTE